MWKLTRFKHNKVCLDFDLTMFDGVKDTVHDDTVDNNNNVCVNEDVSCINVNEAYDSASSLVDVDVHVGDDSLSSAGVGVYDGGRAEVDDGGVNVSESCGNTSSLVDADSCVDGVVGEASCSDVVDGDDVGPAVSSVEPCGGDPESGDVSAAGDAASDLSDDESSGNNVDADVESSDVSDVDSSVITDDYETVASSDNDIDTDTSLLVQTMATLLMSLRLLNVRKL